MKILFLDQFSDPGGAQKCLLDLLPAVREAGWSADVALPGKGPVVDQVRSLGGTVHSFPDEPYRSYRKSLADGWRFARQAPGLSARIRRIAEDVNARLIYVNGPRLLPAAAWAARGRLPLLFHCHNHISQRAAAWVAGRSLRWAGASVITCCRFAAAPIARFVARGKLHLVHNGVAETSPATREPSVESEIRIGVIGRIAPEKGQLEFLAAARLLAKALPRCRFVISGEALFDDRDSLQYRRSLEPLAAHLPVEFLGWRDDVFAVMRSLDLLVVPSIREAGMPRVLLEAQAVGLPIVAFPTGGIPEAIVDGETGFLVDPPTPSELAAKILALLLHHPERLGKVAAAGRSAWRERFTLENYQRQVIQIIAAIAAASPQTEP